MLPLPLPLSRRVSWIWVEPDAEQGVESLRKTSARSQREILAAAVQFVICARGRISREALVREDRETDNPLNLSWQANFLSSWNQSSVLWNWYTVLFWTPWDQERATVIAPLESYTLKISCPERWVKDKHPDKPTFCEVGQVGPDTKRSRASFYDSSYTLLISNYTFQFSSSPSFSSQNFWSNNLA